MAPSKRARPAFSPPRPRKSTTKPSKSTTSKPTTSKSKPSASKSNASSRPTSKSKSSTTTPRRRSNLVSPTPSASDSLASDQDPEDDDASSHPPSSPHASSPEPDYILAEITHDPPSTESPIPPGLIHRILHSQFTAPENTKLSKDARELVAKYIEVFVREAIMRCAFEKGGNDGEGVGEGGTGWLELEDLEKVAVQLCLDF